MALSPAVANRLWQWANRGSARQFRSALERVARVQSDRLSRYLCRNAGTDFGRRHGFAAIDSIDSYRARVPPSDYDAISPYVDRIAAGEPGVLTNEPVVRLMPSSGSTRSVKLIPYTRSLQREFNAAVAPWIDDLYRGDPALRAGPAYWSISQAFLTGRIEVRSDTRPTVRIWEASPGGSLTR
jgi:antitoxin (DNA-binding transcriptional repressor) of toxin-antitoxin stability system